MRIQTYDPKRTHEQNPDCPMRLAPAPGGGLYCVDCGAGILATSLEVHEGRNMMRDFLAQPDGHCTVDGTQKPGWWRDEEDPK